MLQRYTFLDHPFKTILSNSRQLVSGLDKCVAVFYNHNLNIKEALIFNGELSSLGVNDTDFIDEIRVSTKKSNWIKPEQIPFSAKSEKIEQLSFIDEEKSSVLELRFINPFDNKADIIYFYFKNNIGNFKLSNTNEAMGVAIKEVIQNLIYNQIALTLKDYYNNKAVHQKISSNTGINSLKTENTQLNEEKLKQTKEIYTYLLNEISIGETTEFVLSKAAIVKISNLNLSLVETRKILQDTLEILINKYNLENVYEITDYDIVVSRITNNSLSIAEESLSKTALFLDRYEYAAKLLKSKNQKITGTNIGNACEPNISAAAISDILKKHHSKIVKLLNQHPEKWGVIRNYFKPIVSLSQKNNSLYFNSLGA